MMIYREKEERHCCAEPQAPAELGHLDSSGPPGTSMKALILFKAVCCGGPLLVLAIASGAIALSAVLIGAGGLALAGAAFALLGPVARRRAERLSGRQGGGAVERSQRPVLPAPAPERLVEIAGSEDGAADAPEHRAPAAAR